ncbi:MAG: hypothetical protein S4CHLAM81_09020 [Chlamydiales bacterium]|nr:hypothetical protein [Chlamydiales bacterium]MCH9635682.1 hypothetical protein [Chlamydiales bacterium]
MEPLNNSRPASSGSIQPQGKGPLPAHLAGPVSEHIKVEKTKETLVSLVELLQQLSLEKK